MADKNTSNSALVPVPLTTEAFAPFGDVIETRGNDSYLINNGNCARFHDLSQPSVDGSGTTGISLFEAQHYAFPIALNLLERHPLGSQAFIPMSNKPYLVIVAADTEGRPDKPLVFVTNGKQGVNYFTNTWHGVLTPINQAALFAVVDYIGDGKNLEEYSLPDPYTIAQPSS
ncbi:MAG: ureidoglycolate lyase [Granulosicoccaceae bacterium]